MSPKIVLIAGPSGSGKTTLARRIRLALGEEGCETIHLDDYFCEYEEPFEEHNYDVPEAYDFTQLVHDLTSLVEDKPIRRIRWNFDERKRVILDESYLINPNVRVIVVEGLMALCDPALRKLAFLKIYLDVEPAIGICRRLSRDLSRKDRPGDPLSQISRIERHVIPGYRNHILPSKEFADFVVVNDSYEKLLTVARLIADAYSR